MPALRVFVQCQQLTQTGNLFSNYTQIFITYRVMCPKKKYVTEPLPKMALYICFYVIQRRVPQTSEKISHIYGISHNKNKQVIVHKTASTTTHKRSTFFFVWAISSDVGTLELNNEFGGQHQS
jgi:hypothetical protein